jgi:hypothetical protein
MSRKIVRVTSVLTPEEVNLIISEVNRNSSDSELWRFSRRCEKEFGRGIHPMVMRRVIQGSANGSKIGKRRKRKRTFRRPKTCPPLHLMKRGCFGWLRD